MNINKESFVMTNKNTQENVCHNYTLTLTITDPKMRKGFNNRESG